MTVRDAHPRSSSRVALVFFFPLLLLAGRIITMKYVDYPLPFLVLEGESYGGVRASRVLR